MKPNFQKTCIALVTFFAVFIFTKCSDSKPEAAKPIVAQKSMEALLSEIKADTEDYDIRDIYYNPTTQALSIAITNKDNVIKEHVINTYFFYKNYNLNNYDQIEGLYIYEYKKGKSLAKGDYTKPLVYESKNLGKKLAAFKDKFNAGIYGYAPIHKYLNSKLNDPGSLEIVKVYDVECNEDGTFHCTEDIRAKNAFGVLVLQKIIADVNEDGNIIKIKIE